MDYDFQAAGEFTALRSESGDMVVQVRQIPWRDSRLVSVTSAIAVKVNKDRVIIEHGPGSMIPRINGTPITLGDRKGLPDGGFIMLIDPGYLIGWPDGSLLRVLPNPRGLNTTLYLTPERAGTVHGLLGPFNNSPGEVLETKDGKTIIKDNIKEYRQLYRVFGDSWRISQAESLFDYATGTSTATYQKKDFPDPNPPKLDPRKEASARETCLRAGVPERALAGCILDVAITGEAGFATTTAAAMRPLASPLPVEKTAPATKDQPNAQTFTINLGDHVAVDKPGKGAGRIESPGTRDAYTFTANAGSLVYLKADQNCKNSKLRWGLQDPTGAFLLSLQDQYEMCTDPGRALLKTAGTYTVVVKGDKDATGDYGFTVLPIAADQTFPLQLGEAVGPDKPGKGAGRIESPGTRDAYTFTAAAGALVYLKADPNCKNSKLRWGLQDPTGTFFLYLADQYEMCADPGRALLKTAGTYTVVVKGDKDATGDYGFTVLPIAADQSFPLKIGDHVAVDKPGKGAGRIETPGAQDRYTFTAAAGTSIYLKAEKLCTNQNIRWGVLDNTNTYVNRFADVNVVCEDLGQIELKTGGVYTIVVKGDRDAMGDYGFTLLRGNLDR